MYFLGCHKSPSVLSKISVKADKLEVFGASTIVILGPRAHDSILGSAGSYCDNIVHRVTLRSLGESLRNLMRMLHLPMVCWFSWNSLFLG
jgi:hypothetical protein